MAFYFSNLLYSDLVFPMGHNGFWFALRFKRRLSDVLDTFIVALQKLLVAMSPRTNYSCNDGCNLVNLQISFICIIVHVVDYSILQYMTLHLHFNIISYCVYITLDIHYITFTFPHCITSHYAYITVHLHYITLTFPQYTTSHYAYISVHIPYITLTLHYITRTSQLHYFIQLGITLTIIPKFCF